MYLIWAVESVDNLVYYIHMILSEKIEKIKQTRERYKVYITPLVLILGFILDILTLNRVDQVFDNVILIVHLVIVGTTILLLFGKDTKWGHRLNIIKHAQKIEYLMVFSFGALFSGSMIFFSKSASLASSWPVLLLLLILMLGTEFQRKYFQRLILQVNFYFIALFSYLIVLIPVLRRDMGPSLFIASGIVSLIAISFFFFILYVLDRRSLRRYIKKMVAGVVSIFVIFNILYFTNIIPPIPLSLKADGVYHSVYRISPTNYVGLYESTDWWNFWQKRSKVVNRSAGESIYVFSSVFAPTSLNTKIYHQWQYLDPVKNKWVDSSRIELEVSGGREGGFRGYSKKSNLKDGKWRVVIETERNQKLGRITFKIISTKESVKLEEEIL